MKRCTKCKEEKDESEFYKQKSKRDGLRSNCKTCFKVYYQANQEKISERRSRHYQANRKKFCDLQKNYRQANPEKVSACKREYYQANRKKISEHQNDYHKARKQSDLQFRMSGNLRSRLHSAIRYKQKSGSAVSDLGCSIPQFLEHIESQFQEGMSWDNWGYGKGKWTLDHVYPLAKADLTDRTQLLAVCNWRNLQPLWFEDNRKKKDSVTAEAQALFDALCREFSAGVISPAPTSNAKARLVDSEPSHPAFA